MDSIRIINLPSKTYIEEGDYIAIDNQQDGTQKVQFTNLFDSSLSQSDKIAPANTVGQQFTNTNTEITALRAAVGSPLKASTVAQMTDTNKIYVYTGSESGYTAGNWYYYNGTAWTSGGVYNSIAIETDKTLTVSDMAADAKVVGDDITNLKSDWNNAIEIVYGKNLFNPTTITTGMLGSDGSISSSTTYITSDFIPIENSGNYFFAELPTEGPITQTRYLSLLYSASKQPISASYQNVDDTRGLLIPINYNTAKYLRVSVHAWSESRWQVERGSSFTFYEEYDRKLKLTTYLGATPMNQIIDESEDFISDYMAEHKVPIEPTKQLFDRTKTSLGYMHSDGYISGTSTGTYIHTEKIDVSEHTGDSIYFSIDGVAADVRFVCAYGSDGMAIPSKGWDNSDGLKTPYVVPSGVEKIILSYYNPEKEGKSAYAHFQAEYDEITGYVEYGSFFTITEQEDNNILNGKKWVVCGDSFTNGGESIPTIADGKYQGKRAVYPYLIGNRNNMSVVRFFEGGRTLAYPSDDSYENSLTNPNATWYYQNIPADADYITIYLGINDETHVELGTISDNTTATYYGAWNVVLSWLIVNRPNAHIGIIVTNGLSNSNTAWRTAQIEIANKYGLAFIDLNGDERTPAMLRTCNQNIATSVKQALITKWAVDPETNTHPNAAAHEYESTFIENFLRSI